jgi:hypothetical protein
LKPRNTQRGAAATESGQANGGKRMKAFDFEFIRLPPFVCQKFARANTIFTDRITNCTKTKTGTAGFPRRKTCFALSCEALSKLRSSRGDEAQTEENMEPPYVGCYSFETGSFVSCISWFI